MCLLSSVFETHVLAEEKKSKEELLLQQESLAQEALRDRGGLTRVLVHSLVRLCCTRLL